MTGMDIFNLIAGICSILSLIVSLFVANKVKYINRSNHQKAKAKGNARVYQAGRDMNK